MAWEIDYRSGVQQDHRGRKFRLAVNSRGKQDKVYIQDDPSAEPARMIPVPEPKVSQPRRKIITTTVNGKKVPVVHMPRRLHVIECRMAGGSEVLKLSIPNESWSALEQRQLQPLVRLNAGEVAQLLQPAPTDYHVQYHIDEEVK